MDIARRKVIFGLQVCTLLGIWGMFSGIIYWLSRAIYNAVRLHDVPNATIVITIVAMCVFIVLVCVLTYVFIGLQLGREKEADATQESTGGKGTA